MEFLPVRRVGIPYEQQQFNTPFAHSGRYFGPRRQWDCRGASNLGELHQRLSQIMIRRLKAEVLSQLPPKIRQRIPFELPKEAAKVCENCSIANMSQDKILIS